MTSAMRQFYTMLWQGMKSVIIPPFNISLASLLLGILVVDLSISIFGTIIRLYASTSHSIGRIGNGVKRRVRR